MFQNLITRVKIFFADKIPTHSSSLHTKRKRTSVLLTRHSCKPFYPLYNDSSKLLKTVVDLLVDEIEKEIDTEFNSASLILLNRSIQHFESIVTLTEQGLYGDAWILLRSVMSDMNMIYYLHFNPELIEKFLSERGDTYQLDKSFKESFSESKIIDSLHQHDLSISKTSFSKLSKASHASSWGSQLFGQENSSKSYSMKYGPGYEFKKAVTMLSVILGGSLDYVNIILNHRSENGLDVNSGPWARIQKEQNMLIEPVKKLAQRGVQIIQNYNSNS